MAFQSPRSRFIHHERLAPDLLLEALLRPLRFLARGVAADSDLEEPGGVPHHAGVEAHHFESSEHVVYLRGTLDGEYLHGVGVRSRGRSGRARSARSARGGWRGL